MQCGNLTYPDIRMSIPRKVMSRVMRKIDFGIWQKSITGGGLTAPWLPCSKQDARGQGRWYAACLVLDALLQHGCDYRAGGSVPSGCCKFIYFLLPHWVPATWRSRAHTGTSAAFPSGNALTTLVLRRISRFSRPSHCWFVFFSNALTRSHSRSWGRPPLFLQPPVASWISAR